MNNNEKKDTYDKLLGSGQGELFSESGFDEMQKAKNYEIGFKCFRAFFWIMYIFSMAFMLVASAYENLPITLMGLGAIYLCTAFHIIYASKAAAAGVMNRKYAETMSKKAVLVSGLLMFILWSTMFMVSRLSIEMAGVYINLAIYYVGDHLCARKNMKVLEKMLNEDSENEE